MTEAFCLLSSPKPHCCFRSLFSHPSITLLPSEQNATWELFYEWV